MCQTTNSQELQSQDVIYTNITYNININSQNYNNKFLPQLTIRKKKFFQR
jgi:hypothetical protein